MIESICPVCLENINDDESYNKRKNYISYSP